jgi:hypothetical protein
MNIYDSKARHAYDVETTVGCIRVEANSRSIAATKARKAGYTVLSVNMVG